MPGVALKMRCTPLLALREHWVPGGRSTEGTHNGASGTEAQLAPRR